MRLLAIIVAATLVAGCNSSPSSKKQEEKADNWTFGPFVKSTEINPILLPDSTSTFRCPIRNTMVKWEEKDVFNPAAIVRNDTVFLLYRSEDKTGKYAGTSRIGLAYSTDGLHFAKHPVPVFYPDNDSLKKYEWEGGCEDPRIVEDNKGTYYMTYTAYDGSTARLFIATSKNLVEWVKHGSVFAKAENGKYIDYWSKSGSIVAKRVGNKIMATKINGKYWMYWGESNIYLATSPNLIDWTPIPETDPAKKQFDSLRNYEAFKIAFGPRKGKFDSQLVEPGPPALLTDNGIVFIYNSRNSPGFGDANLPAGTYSAGQILADRNDPFNIIDRSENNFFSPDKPYEITGQVNNVCFLEGLVYFKNKWFLYYGTADEQIAVAVK